VALLEEAQRDFDQLLRHAGQAREISDAHPFLVEDSHDVRADRKRKVRLTLEVDGERQQNFGEGRRQWEPGGSVVVCGRRPPIAIRPFAEQPIPEDRQTVRQRDVNLADERRQ
jgi:hypothetical protein